MNPGHVVFACLLALVLFPLGLFYYRRQLRTLRGLANSTLPEEEDRYLRCQARWRLISSALLMVLAVGLVAAFVFLEQPAHEIAERTKALRDAGEEPERTPAERLFLRIYIGFWIVFLLILLVVVMLAAADLWSTRRYGLRQRRRLLDDRRAMIARQAHRLRQERNERN